MSKETLVHWIKEIFTEIENLQFRQTEKFLNSGKFYFWSNKLFWQGHYSYIDERDLLFLSFKNSHTATTREVSIKNGQINSSKILSTNNAKVLQVIQ